MRSTTPFAFGPRPEPDLGKVIVVCAALVPIVGFIRFVTGQALARISSNGLPSLLMLALAIVTADVAPARAQTSGWTLSDWTLELPDYLLEKGKPDQRQKATKPKLKDPKCPECQREWQELKDALASWYFLQFTEAEHVFNDEQNKPDGDTTDAEKAKKAANAGLAALGIPASGRVRDDAAQAHIQRSTPQDERYGTPIHGDKDQLAVAIRDLIRKLRACYAKRCLPKANVQIPEVPPCYDTKAEQDALVKQLTDLAKKLETTLDDLLGKKGTGLGHGEDGRSNIGDPGLSESGSMDPQLMQAKANYLAADNALFVASRHGKICPKEKTSKPQENPPKETPPNETPPPKEQRSMLPGPPRSEGGVNYTPGLMQTVTIATDRMQWCTFGSAQAVATVLAPTDISGNLIASAVPPNPAATAEKMPDASGQPPATPGEPSAFAERPKKVKPSPVTSVLPHLRRPPMTQTADNPPPANTPEQPGTSERTPPGTPTTPSAVKRRPSTSDRPPSAGTPEQSKRAEQPPPPIDNPAPPIGNQLPTPEQVTIDFNEKVDIKELAENLKLATAEPSTALKLKPLTPDLPGSGDKSTQDKGSDKDPATGRMGSDGHARITTNEPQAYRLPSTPGAPTHYRAEIDPPEHNGFIAETTGKPVKPAELASALPAGVKATIDTVQFGGHTHARVGLDWPRSQQLDPAALAASISRAIGARLETDICRRTKPAPALGPEPASASATVGALPATVIKLRRSIEVEGAR